MKASLFVKGYFILVAAILMSSDLLLCLSDAAESVEDLAMRNANPEGLVSSPSSLGAFKGTIALQNEPSRDTIINFLQEVNSKMLGIPPGTPGYFLGPMREPMEVYPEPMEVHPEPPKQRTDSRGELFPRNVDEEKCCLGCNCH